MTTSLWRVAPFLVSDVLSSHIPCFSFFLSLQSLTPRQIRLLSSKGDGSEGRSRDADDVVCNSGGTSTVREIDPPYLYNSREIRRRQRARAEAYASLIDDEGLSPETTCPWPSWQSTLRAASHAIAPKDEGNSAVHFDSNFTTGQELDDLWVKLQERYVEGGSDRSSDEEA